MITHQRVSSSTIDFSQGVEYAHYKFLNRKPTQLKSSVEDFMTVRAFQKPVTCKGPKLYVVKSGHTILYVGFTSQSITTRLRYGFTATGRHGYHGYRWKDHKDELDILIWCFPDNTRAESIEAEVVFRIRQRTGLWPILQTEIHFHAATKTETLLADQISKIVMGPAL